MPAIKTIIVDDEKEAREGIALLLQNDEEIEVKAICKNGVEAVSSINSVCPDLVFLDIQMPVVNGFQVLNSLLVPILPAIIFVTAYDQYTLKAFEVHAVDYLLKPFTDDRFYASLAYAKQQIGNRKGKEAELRLKKLVQSRHRHEETTLVKESVPNKKIVKSRLVVKADGRVHFLPLSEIIWVEAYDYYIKIHVKDRFYLVRDSLKNMEESLPEQQFIRIHKSSIINVDYLKQIHPNVSGEYEIQLATGPRLKVSRNYKDRLKGII